MTGLVVYDLEYTTWPGARDRGWSGPGEHREVVQIGAVRLSAEDLSETAALSVLVRPRLNPVLSDYFIDLTGITQARVDNEGTDFAEALGRLGDFAHGMILLANGADEAVLRENCGLAGLSFPLANLSFLLEGRCGDASAILARCAGQSGHVFSCLMGEAFGLTLNEAAHDALGDARQVAAALRHLVARGEVTVPELVALSHQ